MLEGGCTCHAVRYRMTARPMIVHCCHCTWCQRETGASFALNAVIEASGVTLLKGKPEAVHTPSNSGKGQQIHRCPECKVAVWSTYAAAGEKILFVRVGTLDQPETLPPDVHIFTQSMQPWMTLPASARAFKEFYAPPEVWSPEALKRWAAVKADQSKA